MVVRGFRKFTNFLIPPDIREPSEGELGGLVSLCIFGERAGFRKRGSGVLGDVKDEELAGGQKRQKSGDGEVEVWGGGCCSEGLTYIQWIKLCSRRKACMQSDARLAARPGPASY